MDKSVSALTDYWRQVSRVGTHHDECCFSAQKWLQQLDRSGSLIGDVWHDPVWIRDRWEWGPLNWPVQWCGLVQSKVIDCAALASVASHVISERGVPCRTVQAILEYPEPAVESWRKKWEAAEMKVNWIEGRFVYHEVSAVFSDEGLRIWDPTENRWYGDEDVHRESYAKLTAIRVPDGWTPLNKPLRWGTQRLNQGIWIQLQ